MSFTLSRRASMLGLALAALLPATSVIAATAPNFTLPNSKGEQISLSDFAGKTVVLEWTNHGCPYVQRHYGTGNMQTLQQSAAGDDVVWLSIISSRPGSQGYVEGPEADALTASRNAAPRHVLLDPEGTVGRLYAAKTTPHMFVINGTGEVAYQGAIDDAPSASYGETAQANNFVLAALAAVKAGRSPDPASTRPYGCSVKY